MLPNPGPGPIFAPMLPDYPRKRFYDERQAYCLLMEVLAMSKA